MPVRSLGRIVFALVCAAAPLGCSGSSASVKGPNFGSEDGTKIAGLISEFDDAKARAAKFKKCFASPAPTTWKAYSNYMYDVEGAPKVTGDTATATVKIRPDGVPGEPFTREWTFVKAGADWKLKDAPLK